jgi:murein DD-endopeptidase MepM/ murein hydrolase activator NlpD
MSKKFLTLVIIPHTKGKHKTISLTEKRLKTVGGIAGFLVLALIIFLADYIVFQGTRLKYKNLFKENEDQKQTLVQYEETINKLQSNLDDFEDYAKKLNVMAGLKSTETLKEFGVGDADNGGSDPELRGPSESSSGQIVNLESKAEGIEKNLSTLVNFFEDQALRLAGTPSIWPTKGYMSSHWGWRNDPFTGKRTFHYGIDIATHHGNPVVATADGIVLKRTKDKIGGNTIQISHRGGYTTVYCHLSKFLVKTGQKVKRGDTIGLIGKTGKALAPHVHYAVKLNGKNVNPWYYILEE